MITSWSEMPIGMMERIRDISKLHCSDDEKTFKTAALLAGIPYDEFMNLPIDEARDIVADTSFIHIVPEKRRVKRVYHIGTRDYKLFKDFTEMTTAQYIDFQAIVGHEDDMMAELMAIVLIPKGCKYNDGYDNAEIVEELRDNLSVEEALSIADFFIKRFDRSIRRVLTMSDAMMKAARLTASKEKKEMLMVMEKQVKLLNEELRSECGWDLWKRWPK